MLKISNKSKILAIAVLIGGKSSRFGSDKGLFELSGKPLISYLLDILYKINYNIFLVANSISQMQDYMKKIDIKNLTAFIIDEKDINSDDTLQTPMIGLYSAFKELNRLNYKKVIILTCDSPLIKKEVLEYLIEKCKNFDCCIPQWESGFLEPLIAIYPIKKALKSIKRNFKNRLYKLTNILSTHWKINFISIEKEIKQIDSELSTFININELKDIEELKKKYKKKKD